MDHCFTRGRLRATVTHVCTLEYVAKMLGEDPELLEAIVYNDDNLTYGAIISVYTGRAAKGRPAHAQGESPFTGEPSCKTGSARRNRCIRCVNRGGGHDTARPPPRPMAL